MKVNKTILSEKERQYEVIDKILQEVAKRVAEAKRRAAKGVR